MERVGLYVIVATGVGAAALFAVEPTLDMNIALYFRSLAANEPQSFVFQFIAMLRDVNRHLTIAFFVLAAAVLAIKFAWPGLPMLMPPRTTLMLFLSLLIGPGLLVNGILKEQWGRPRPGEVVELNGALAFKPWWDPTGECRSNCSFPSGETSTAFALLAVAAAAPTPWSGPAIVATAVFATAVGLGRIATTGHFASDVIFAGVLTSLVVWLVHGFLFRWPTTCMTDAALEARLERAARSGRRYVGAIVPRFP
jgi:lipid A 4'-phosphatase